MGKVIAIASGKGGVGKTTLTASLGVALAHDGAKVLVADGDFGMRDLDLAFGVENDILFDAVDLWKKKCFAEDALIALKNNLDLLPASQRKRWEDVGRKGYMKLLKDLAKRYEYVLVDAPAGLGRGVESILNQADQLLVVVEPFWSSIRAAEKLMLYCNKHRFFNYALVINQVPAVNENGEVRIEEILSSTIAEILGTILPYSKELRKAIQNGEIIQFNLNSPYLKMLEPLVDCVGDTDWDESDIINLFNSQKEKVKEVSSKSQSIQDTRGLNKEEESQHSKNEELSPNEISSSLKNRTRSIQWRTYRRR